MSDWETPPVVRGPKGRCGHALAPGERGPDCWPCWAKKRDEAKRTGKAIPRGARLDQINPASVDWDGSYTLRGED